MAGKAMALMGWVVLMLVGGQALMAQSTGNIVPAASVSPTPANLATAMDDDQVEIGKVVLRVFEEREVPSRAAGLIRTSHIREGMLVDKDFLMMQLDDEVESLEVDRLRAELSIAGKQAESQVEIQYAQKSVEVAQAELKRALESNRKFPGLVPEGETDRLNLIRQRAEAELAKAEFQQEVTAMQKLVKSIELSQSELGRDRRSIFSPMRGRIEQVLKREGEWVDVSQPVAKLVRLDQLKIETKISAELGRLDLAGKPVVFRADADWLQQRTYQGQVYFVESAFNPVDSTVRVWLVIENPDLELRPGMSGSAVIDTASLSR